MSNSRKSSKGAAGSGLLQSNNSTGAGSTGANPSGSGASSHQHHKNLRRHLDMGGQQSYGVGASATGNGMNGMDGNMGSGMNSSQTATANLFEIKKRSIDFF